MSFQAPPPPICKTARALATVEAELKKRGPLTALTGGTIFLRLDKREKELAAAKKADARAPGLARPAAATAKPASTTVPPMTAKRPPIPPGGMSPAALAAETDEEIYDRFAAADPAESTRMFTDPATNARLLAESARRTRGGVR